jgi:hypothetical protein
MAPAGDKMAQTHDPFRVNFNIIVGPGFRPRDDLSAVLAAATGLHVLKREEGGICDDPTGQCDEGSPYNQLGLLQTEGGISGYLKFPPDLVMAWTRKRCVEILRALERLAGPGNCIFSNGGPPPVWMALRGSDMFRLYRERAQAAQEARPAVQEVRPAAQEPRAAAPHLGNKTPKKRLGNVRRIVADRDESRCIITGSSAFNVCHIFPVSKGDAAYRALTGRPHVDSVENAMCMSPTLHHLFDRHQAGFQREETGLYRLVLFVDDVTLAPFTAHRLHLPVVPEVLGYHMLMCHLKNLPTGAPEPAREADISDSDTETDGSPDPLVHVPRGIAVNRPEAWAIYSTGEVTIDTCLIEARDGGLTPLAGGAIFLDKCGPEVRPKDRPVLRELAASGATGVLIDARSIVGSNRDATQAYMEERGIICRFVALPAMGSQIPRQAPLHRR